MPSATLPMSRRSADDLFSFIKFSPRIYLTGQDDLAVCPRGHYILNHSGWRASVNLKNKLEE
jgi:hypothetical protein